jgi:hypothetical protein
MVFEPFTVLWWKFTGIVFLDQLALGNLQLFEEVILRHEPFFNLLLLLVAEVP